MRWRMNDETVIYSRQNNLSERLAELEQEGALISPCQFFYVVAAPKYRERGNVPPLLYVDRMMQFAGREYYVALMSAVDIYRNIIPSESDSGAADDGGGYGNDGRSGNGSGSDGKCKGDIDDESDNGGKNAREDGDFSVMVIGERMTLGRRKRRPVKFYARQNDVSSEILRIETAFGPVNVSSPLLTALDLVQKESEVGGLARVAEALTVLADSIEFGADKTAILQEFPTAIIQRLGHLLDAVQAHSRASELYRICADSGMTFRPTPLKASSAAGIGFETDPQWMVIVNAVIHIMSQ